MPTVEDVRAEMERDMPMKGVPKAAVDLVWSLAWEHGHAGGVSDIACYYDDFRALALLAAGVRKE